MLLKTAITFTVPVMNRRVNVPWGGIFLGIAAAIGLGVNMWINSQPHGTLRYGVCRTFLEMHVRFPTHLVINDVYETQNQARIEYVEIDTSGQHQTKQIECFFGPDRQGNTTLTKVMVNRTSGNLSNREPVPTDELRKFVATLPIVMGANPDTRLPELLFKIRDGEVPSEDQLLSLHRLNKLMLAK